MVASVVTAVGLSDEELAEAAAAGDDEAFADLRRRYAGPLYDLLARMTHSREEAAALARATFDQVREGLPGRPADRRLRPWLYAVARQIAVDAARRRQVASMEDEAAMSGAEGDDVDEALVADAWRAAAALGPDAYAVLHYQLRAGLDPREIAEAMSLRPEMVYTALTRAHEALSDAFALLQFARRGKRDCAGLELLIGLRPPVPLDPATRQALRRHLEGCAKCRNRRAAFAAPAEMLSALPPVTPPKNLRLVHSRSQSPVSLPEVRSLPPRRRHNHWAVPAAALGGAAVAVLFLVSRGPLPDRTPPVVPQVMSTTHVPWVASTHRSVEVQWSGAADRAGERERDSGVAGYSVSWSSQPGDVPAARVQTDAERSASPELADGVWWFHLRTVDRAGNATEPVHVGPFVITEPAPSPSRPRPAPLRAL